MVRPFRTGLGVELGRIQTLLDHPDHEKDVRFCVGVNRLVYYRDFSGDYNPEEGDVADRILRDYSHLLNFAALARTAP